MRMQTPKPARGWGGGGGRRTAEGTGAGHSRAVLVRVGAEGVVVTVVLEHEAEHDG